MKKLLTLLAALLLLTCFTGCLSLDSILENFVSTSIDDAVEAEYGTVYSSAYDEDDDEELFLAAEGGNTCKNLTDSDVKAYYANRYAISLIAEEYYNGNWTAQQLLDAYEVQLEQLGISGPNRYAKIMMIEKCDLILTTEDGVRSNQTAMQTYADAGLDPEAMIASMTAALRKEINETDFAVVKRNWKK